MRFVPFIFLFFYSFFACAENALHNDRFGKLHIFKPSSEPHAAVVLLSSDKGWDDRAEKLALALRDKSILVMGIDSKSYFASILAEDGECSYLAGEIEHLSQSIQKTVGLDHYLNPVVIGTGLGSKLAYLIYSQYAPPFLGLITADFRPEADLKRRICEGKNLKVEFDAKTKNQKFTNLTTLGSNWLNLPSLDAESASSVVAKIDAVLPKPTIEEPDSVSSDLPVVELPSESKKYDFFVLFVSGDGGWATIDKEIGEYLSQHEVSVLGFDALKFFWTKRDADQTAKALDQAIRQYSKLWHKSKVVIAGFSFGADVLPPAISRLSKGVQANIKSVALLSPSFSTDFEVNLSDWIGLDESGPSYDLLPEFSKLKQIPILCLYGVDEADQSLCPKLEAPFVAKGLPGSHHFDGEYENLAQLILKQANAS